MQRETGHLAVTTANGPACAAILAGALGVAALGVCTVLAEASPAAKAWLTWSTPSDRSAASR